MSLQLLRPATHAAVFSAIRPSARRLSSPRSPVLQPALARLLIPATAAFRSFTPAFPTMAPKATPSKRARTEATAAGNGAEAPPKMKADPAEAERMLQFINKAWTAYHAVDEAAKRLTAAGYTRISERDEWKLQPGGRYFFTRNQSTIVAFAVGAKYKPGNGFYIVGAHTDSPCLKLKPVSKYHKTKHTMVNVEPYGGGLWATWFDRDLTVAGRVLVRQADGTIAHRLVKVDRPLMRIPMLAIHLNREIMTDGFNINAQNHLSPVLATSIKDALNAESDKGENHHGSALLNVLAEELGCDTKDIFDLELNVCDTQPGVIGGVHNEFVWVGRLDNLAMSYCSLAALLDTTSEEALAEEVGVRAVALFDHEEVGSSSAQGAGGPVMLDTIKRVATVLGEQQEGVVVRALQRSFLVSADMAHALHPNYVDKHDPEHQPLFHQGIVIKHNQNQRYSTNAVSAGLFRELGKRNGIPVQEFAIRSDLACGSTIGPILSSSMGVRTVDVGAPQLSMHSIREMMGVDDVSYTVAHFKAFFAEFSKMDAIIDVDGLAPPDIKGTIDDVPCGHVH
uniref:aspartyl aminopeptidase n=1 Tax=Tetraselmis chuii TaxID=63592 RepID=A0A7S1SPJ3_9CHLO|mmetsp:Transcript_18725/g.33405  ORF Transcript_18725/g.33405 Transcript_18725/m.33405 type:complete len:565 (+) Transcript_18725:113-1807(+)|eukprot:CAMPEP_0177761894 /NCGR_PEP_ID=MMETSP0491_2-20121128/6051_1 /TAXON_ID=63592 /ORGANISM="Tetraselmis chuii, Strain PLY429" /LENGTH=564 /DNA_ID=CAMNT_0019277905 /DNA_START=48 /DNA_END=1742 /DNA_ORIENTATION=-